MTTKPAAKILIAMDSFKGSLSASQACDIIATGLGKTLPETILTTCPLADGGEGTLQVLLDHWDGGQVQRCEVMGPLPTMTVSAQFGWWPTRGLAVIEAAQACGLPYLEPRQRQPLAATTYGVGQLMLAAADLGAEKIILTVGGSATMDGGMGAARALGWQALDQTGQPIAHGATGLLQLARFTPPHNRFKLPIEVWCDVHSPLLGPQGAAAVFGPQKGANPHQIRLSEKGLQRLVFRWSSLGKRHSETRPGSGAAGGLAYGMAAFSGAKLVFGAEQIAEAVHLSSRISESDWVISGEGRFDATSLAGKCVSQVAMLTRQAKKPLLILAGALTIDPKLIGAVHGLAVSPAGLADTKTLANARTHLQKASIELGQYINSQPMGHRA